MSFNCLNSIAIRIKFPQLIEYLTDKIRSVYIKQIKTTDRLKNVYANLFLFLVVIFYVPTICIFIHFITHRIFISLFVFQFKNQSPSHLVIEVQREKIKIKKYTHKSTFSYRNSIITLTASR